MKLPWLTIAVTSVTDGENISRAAGSSTPKKRRAGINPMA